MPYSDFKNLEEITQKFKVSIISSGPLFREVKTVQASKSLMDILEENLPLALNINTEKARSELIIAPVLVEVRKLLNRTISLFSGIEFKVDEQFNLTGYCDFIISNSPDQVFLKSPIICIVEAKNENIKSGFAQCMAEMIAARMFNEKNSVVYSYILGVITTGSNWKFLKLEQGNIFIDYDEFLIGQVNNILSIFKKAVDDNQLNAV
jgi:hypothetical protein